MKSVQRNFLFTSTNLEIIRRLNLKLKKEECRIRPFAKELNNTLEKQLQEKEIDDYNITTKISLFSNNIRCNKRHNVEAGNPFKEVDFLLLHDKLDDVFYTDNWNEFGEGHPLANDFICYSMHCLLFDYPISFLDLINIDDVWLEIKVDYQFFIETGNEGARKGGDES